MIEHGLVIPNGSSLLEAERCALMPKNCKTSKITNIVGHATRNMIEAIPAGDPGSEDR